MKTLGGPWRHLHKISFICLFDLLCWPYENPWQIITKFDTCFYNRAFGSWYLANTGSIYLLMFSMSCNIHSPCRLWSLHRFRSIQWHFHYFIRNFPGINKQKICAFRSIIYTARPRQHLTKQSFHIWRYAIIKRKWK